MGSILAPFDDDGKIPVYGFGGIPKYMEKKTINDCFPLNGNIDDPFITGLDNIVDTYRKRIPEIESANPARFGSILETFRQYVEKDIKG